MQLMQFEANKRVRGAKERKVTRCYLLARGQWQPSAVEVDAIGEEPMPAGSRRPEIFQWNYFWRNFDINDKCAFYSHLSEGKGNVNEDCNEDFIRDPRQTRKPFTSSNNLMWNKLVCRWIIKMWITSTERLKPRMKRPWAPIPTTTLW